MSDKPGRNALCPCGSGKKYKKCCGFNLPPVGEELSIPIPMPVRLMDQMLSRKVRKVLLQRQQEYYLKAWISSKIPALNNKTPLQAVKTKDGRLQLQLEVLINRMEGMNEQRPAGLSSPDGHEFYSAQAWPAAGGAQLINIFTNSWQRPY